MDMILLTLLLKESLACLISDNLTNTKKITLAKVNNVLDTLEIMAKNARMRSKAKFIAVTGSVARLNQRYDAFSFIKSG